MHHLKSNRCKHQQFPGDEKIQRSKFCKFCLCWQQWHTSSIAANTSKGFISMRVVAWGPELVIMTNSGAKTGQNLDVADLWPGFLSLMLSRNILQCMSYWHSGERPIYPKSPSPLNHIGSNTLQNKWTSMLLKCTVNQTLFYWTWVWAQLCPLDCI